MILSRTQPSLRIIVPHSNSEMHRVTAGGLDFDRLDLFGSGMSTIDPEKPRSATTQVRLSLIEMSF